MGIAVQSTFFDIPQTVESVKATTHRSGTFIDNMRLPVHRWFRYSAGFSAEWVETEIRRLGNGCNVFDPFAGSGTTLLAAESAGQAALGQEAHPFVYRVGDAKLGWNTSIEEFLALARSILDEAKAYDFKAERHELLSKCYDDFSLSQIGALHAVILKSKEDRASWRLCWLAFVSILRVTSHVGTAQWQYLLPKKSKSKVSTPFRAFEAQVMLMSSDMSIRQKPGLCHKATILLEDSRREGRVPTAWADLIITSPPYINNYDYADATRLEMTVLGEISGWSDLQTSVRSNLVRSCTQHVAPYAKDYLALLESGSLRPIAKELKPIVTDLTKEKSSHGGKKGYDSMIVHYFHDMAAVWAQLRRIAKNQSKVCFVLGDSAPYGIYVPVDRFHGELALAAGFKSYEFKKLRDRNLKWKNRKHQVPLKEGQLWLHG